MLNGQWRASEAERDELETLLRSELLKRSPSVYRIAEYVFRKYIEGQADELKEYTVAVDALGKAPDFDPKENSIVRVEIHRLRKKLDLYYATEGSKRPLRILLDAGSYVPRFEPNKPAEPVGLELPAEPTVILPATRTSAPEPGRKWLAPIVLATLVTALCVCFGWSFLHRSIGGIKPVTIRMLSGAAGMTLSSPSGHVWHGEQWVQGGRTIFAIQRPEALVDLPVHVQRQGDFEYAIPLPQAPHELRLYFGPRLATASSPDAVQTRRFDVCMNGEMLIDAVDPANARSHPGEWITKVFHDAMPSADGKLHLSFRSRADTAYVSAIEITPGVRGRLAPLRILARASPYTDPHGKVWSADQYVAGGIVVGRTDMVTNTADTNLFSGERYGAFRYHIPVTKGRYTLRLYFAEAWFGQGLGGGGIGSRRFDVYVNDAPVLENFDVLQEAGQSRQALVKSFAGLVPNLDGYFDINFVPRVNNALVNALELIPETP